MLAAAGLRLSHGALASSEATVRAVKQIDGVWGGRKTPAEDAVQPFLIVQLAFVPHGKTDPVVAVDMVDDRRVSSAERGAMVTITYSTTDPRWAQINGASRTYILEKPAHLWPYCADRNRFRCI